MGKGAELGCGNCWRVPTENGKKGKGSQCGDDLISFVDTGMNVGKDVVHQENLPKELIATWYIPTELTH